jgi:hypothetical protein
MKPARAAAALLTAAAVAVLGITQVDGADAPARGDSLAGFGPAPTAGARCVFVEADPDWRPDDACTPGEVMTTDLTKVCEVGYSESVRRVSEAQKDRVLASYGLSEPGFTGNVDHRLALSLGGSNADANLAPISASANQRKNTIEQRVRTDVCGGTLTVAQAQARFLAGSDWTEADRQLGRRS